MNSPLSPSELRVYSADQLSRMSRRISADQKPTIRRSSSVEPLSLIDMIESPGSPERNHSDSANKLSKIRMNGSWKNILKSPLKHSKQITLQDESWRSFTATSPGQYFGQESSEELGWDKLAQQQLANFEELIPKTLSSLIPDSVQTGIAFDRSLCFRLPCAFESDLCLYSSQQ